VNEKAIDFYPTMMYTSRVHKFTVKNTSTIKMHYNCRIVSAENGKIDSGFFTVSPHNGAVNPNCEQPFTVRFSPTEVEQSNERLLVISMKNLNPDQEKLILELNGETERPICHFELAPSNYREKNPDVEAKYNII
jgi:hydrocephalus-inducing protein